MTDIKMQREVAHVKFLAVRADAVAAMWARLEAAMGWPRERDPRTVESRAGVLQYIHNRGRLPPGIVRTAIDASVLGWEDWQPPAQGNQRPCRHPPGSVGKIEALAARVQAGEELWHEEDRIEYDR